MKNKIYLLMILGIFFISLASAESIGTFAQNTNVQLYQTCNNCTYCNFTAIKYPNGTNFLTNVIATKDGSYYYYNLDGGNTTVTGNYRYCYECGNTGDSSTGCLDFMINPSGRQLNSEDSIANGFVLILLFGVSVFLLIFARTTEQEGVKLFFSVIGYIMLLLSIGTGYIFLQGVNGGLAPMAKASLFVIGIVFIVMMYYIFINMTKTALSLWRAKKGFTDLDNSATF